MKKFIFITILVFFGFLGFAQQNNTDLFSDKSENIIEFKGIPIEGSAKDFSDKLKLQGYEEGLTPTLLTGKFIGKDCTVYLSEYNDTINCVTVFMDESYSNWDDFKSDYNSLVDLYTKKYGSPDMIKEKFHYPYEAGDGHEYYALKSGKLDIGARWDVFDTGDRCGWIGISVTDDFRITIMYVNSINRKKADDKQEESYLDEI